MLKKGVYTAEYVSPSPFASAETHTIPNLNEHLDT